jgi:acyl carrier protein
MNILLFKNKLSYNTFVKKIQKKLKKVSIEDSLLVFFKKKDSKLSLKKIKKVNLIKSGIIDSLDIVDLTSFIKKKFKVNLDISDPQTLKQYEKFEEIKKLIKK